MEIGQVVKLKYTFHPFSLPLDKKMRIIFCLLFILLAIGNTAAQSLSIFKDESGNLGFMDQHQNIVIQPNYSVLKPFSENVAVAAIYSENGDQYGFINYEGKWVIEAKYADAHPFSQGLAAVYKNDQWTFIDHSGNQAFSFTFEYADKFENGGTWVNYQGYEKYLSRTGIMYSEYVSNPLLRKERGLTVVTKDEKYGLIDSSGNEIIKPIFNDLLWNPDEGYFVAYIEDREAKLDNEFKITPRVYASLKKEKFGFVDFYGNLIVERIYDSADETDHFFHIVSIKKKYGLVDATGKEIVPCIYDFIDYFYEGHSTASLKGVEYDIDKNGKLTKK